MVCLSGRLAMTLRCRKKPLLGFLLAVAALSASVCLFAVAILSGEEEATASRVLQPPGLRPVKYSSQNRQRGILNVGEDALPARMRRQQFFPEINSSLGIVKKKKGPGFHGDVEVTTVPMPRPSGQQQVEEPWPEGKGSMGNCTGPWPGYASCQSKMQWMEGNWKKDRCYATNGVDGSRCSFQLYLSEVEHWCPPLAPMSRLKPKSQIESSKAVVQYDLSPLIAKMSKNAKLDWLVRRISTHWSHWSTALHSLQSQAPFSHSTKKILVHIGALSDKAGFKFAENADHGGPLGELVQWSDLIASLHLLGHTLEFSTEVAQLQAFVAVSSVASGPCPSRAETQYDAIYIDIVGLRHFKKLVKNRLQHYQCLFRVLDSFGTEPQFNFKGWKPPKRSKGDYGQAWGNWNFNPRQFLTMYPHTPDNSFLGFVVGSNRREATPLAKKNIGLVYGKELYMWQGKRKYLDLVSRYVDVHATIGTTQQKKNVVDPSVVPGYVTNHGILNSTELQKLLKEAKVFIGLGFPYEGPAPLEAVANGCVFLNPQLSPPLDRYNSPFLKAKPTLRSLTSQNPYTEHFISDPHVFTFDANDNAAIIRVMEKISKIDSLPGYLPYEFTYEGLLERVMAYLEHQQFCRPHQWPSRDSLVTTRSKEGESCKEACFREGLTCEPELFSFLNTEPAVTKEFGCSEVVTEHSTHGPSCHAHTCSIQKTPLLYSCVGSDPKVQRLCPCRTYHKGQVALCSSCTVGSKS